MEAQGGVYSLVSKESMSQLPDYSSPLPGDETLLGRPIEAVSSLTIDYNDVVSGDLDVILVAMHKIATEMADQISNGIMAHISEICDRTGNVITGELSWNTIGDALEHMDFSFDEHGNHNISIVVNPEGARTLQNLGEPTSQQRTRIEKIISRRKDEWNARRSSRSLPPRRL
jgi:hypothetical protein